MKFYLALALACLVVVYFLQQRREKPPAPERQSVPAVFQDAFGEPLAP